MVQRQPQRSAAPLLTRIERLCQAATRALENGVEPMFGVDLRPLLSGVTRVEARALDNDDKVQVDGGTLWVERACLESIAHGHRNPGDAELDALLYIFHELAHLPQGIGDYPVIKVLRGIGEDALLEMDLAADHFAALQVSALPGRPGDIVKSCGSAGLRRRPPDRLARAGSRP